MKVEATYFIELSNLEREYLMDIIDHYMSGQQHDASVRFELAEELWHALNKD